MELTGEVGRGVGELSSVPNEIESLRFELGTLGILISLSGAAQRELPCPVQTRLCLLSEPLTLPSEEAASLVLDPRR